MGAEGEIATAVKRINARKEARWGPAEPGGAIAGGGVDPDGSALLSGLDLDPREVTGFCLDAREVFLMGVRTGAPPADVGAALWLEGLVIGLLIAERRREGEGPE